MLFENPIFTPPTYSLESGHLQTILPALFRQRVLKYQRERIATPDGDFLDLDWSTLHLKNHKLAFVAHGLEGNSSKHYVTGMIKVLNSIGYDGVAINLRGCSGEMNKLPRFYHHGDSQDIDTVIKHILSTKSFYSSVILIGFSMGGNILLKYLGEQGKNIPQFIKKTLVFSVPCDIGSCSDELSKPSKWIYTKNFLMSLEQKLTQKAAKMPQLISLKDFKSIRNFRDFDNRYTAPLHGFIDADDYYKKVNSLNFIENINVPTLLTNSLNDPFLTDKCFPTEIANKHKYFHLETPQNGGHVGFEVKKSKLTYAEQRALSWFAD